MKPFEVQRIIGDVPYMRLEQAYEMTDFILANDVECVMELGFAHGVSTCYAAAAMDQRGHGAVISIDRESSLELSPGLDELLERLGLAKYVTRYYEPSSYTWRLMKMLEEDPLPRIDLCYIDGAHNWDADGFSFFLVDRLLRPGGWIIFDDLDWNYDSSPTLKDADWVKAMPDDERITPQVRKVFELLVLPHPSYGNFEIKGEWAYAQKLESVAPVPKTGPVEVLRSNYADAEKRDVMPRAVNKVKRLFGG